MAKYSLILVVILSACWLVLSGYFIPMILTFGVISVLLVVGLCYRMDILDRETAPYIHTFPTLVYLQWLLKEIVSANIEVTKAVLTPDMEIKPTMVRIPNRSPSDLASTLYANSITLTPGTVSVEMTDDDILVHALLAPMAKPAGFVEMEHRASRSVGETPITTQHAE